jgi:3-(3-hydroxy-phenyl)propionate hydroxylase
MTVLVVGAGPTGLVAAALLARHGVASVVIERRPDVYPLPRAVHLDDEVMRILQQVGVVEEFLPLTRPALGMRLVDAGLRTLVQFDRSAPIGAHGYPQANLFDQPELERLLRKNLRALDLVELRTGVELTGLAGTRATVRDLETGRATEIGADAVLGCDGAGSTVRGLLRSLGTWDGVYQVCDPSRAATFLQVGRDRYRWEFRLHDGETADSLILDDLLAPWTRGRAVDLVRRVEYRFRAQSAETWRVGRVFLLGDAAHQMPPFIGQGLGTGLRDAANLAWKLAAVLYDGADEQVLATYEAERAPQAEALIKQARTAGWAMTGGQDRAAALRRGVLSLLCRIPPLTRSLLDRGGLPLPAGPLVGRGRLAGTLVPQPIVAGTRFDELLGIGFAVVADGPLEPEVRRLAEALGAMVVPAPPPLREWLRSGHATAAVLRPDRVVMATVDLRGRLRSPL